MAKKVPRKSDATEQDYFKRLYKVLKNNIVLREISVDEIGAYSEEYDKKHRLNWDKLIIRLKKKKQLTKNDIINLTEMSQKHPHQHNLFKRNTIVSIVTVIDEVFSEILRHYYLNHQTKLPLEEIKISFNELDNFTDVKEIKNHLIGREINNILFKEGVKNRLKFFKKELNLKVPESTEHINEFNKLIKLRNLIVHNSCVADKEYIKKYGNKEVGEGEIDITEEYLHEALMVCFYICGFILQSAQIMMHKKHLKSGDYFLNELAHELLKKRKFSYLSEVYKISQDLELDEVNKKMIAINYCLGLKLQKKSSESIEKVLGSYDWSAVGLTLELGLHALRDQDELFYEKLSKEIKDKNLGISEIREWAIFGLYNNKKKYRGIIKELV